MRIKLTSPETPQSFKLHGVDQAFAIKLSGTNVSRGADGKSAYEIAVDEGFEGTQTEWLESLHGKDGYTPIKGIDYFDGKPGDDGYTPVKGVDYFDGQPGKDGVSPTVTTSKSGKVTTITIKDANGTKTATVYDGVDGKTPVKGIDYFDGAKGDPGYTPVKGVDYFDGAKGDPGYTPQKGKDYFDGEKGDPGYTPVRGTDYWTAADKAAMVQDVLAALPVYNGEVADV